MVTTIETMDGLTDPFKLEDNVLSSDWWGERSEGLALCYTMDWGQKCSGFSGSLSSVFTFKPLSLGHLGLYRNGLCSILAHGIDSSLIKDRKWGCIQWGAYIEGIGEIWVFSEIVVTVKIQTITK